MRVDQLITFRRVADERSYTRAAEQLSVSQPAVYQQVRQLEREAGQKLCHVVGKEVMLTAAGQVVYAFAAEVERGHDDVQQQLKGLRDTEQRIIRIGATSYFGTLPLAAERVAARYPGSMVEFRSLHPPEAIEKIRAGAIDFGFFGPTFIPDDLRADPIAQQRIVIAVPPEHPLAGRGRISFAAVQVYALIGYLSGSARAAVDAWSQRRMDAQIRYAALSDSSLTIKTMAVSLNAPATVVEAAIHEDRAAGRLVTLDIEDFAVSYTLSAIHRGRAQLSPAARAYLDELIALGRGSQRARRRTAAAQAAPPASL
jgi:DNA-binding transcriptional LysR family regulator